LFFREYSVAEWPRWGARCPAVPYGLDRIATVPPTGKLIASEFGPEKAGMVFGWVFSTHHLGAACLLAAASAMLIRVARRSPASRAAGANA